jgi:hypothetical protein
MVGAGELRRRDQMPAIFGKKLNSINRAPRSILIRHRPNGDAARKYPFEKFPVSCLRTDRTWLQSDDAINSRVLIISLSR